MKCKNCKTKIYDIETNFCPECGQKIIEKTITIAEIENLHFNQIFNISWKILKENKFRFLQFDILALLPAILIFYFIDTYSTLIFFLFIPFFGYIYNLENKDISMFYYVTLNNIRENIEPVVFSKSDLKERYWQYMKFGLSRTSSFFLYFILYYIMLFSFGFEIKILKFPMTNTKELLKEPIFDTAIILFIIFSIYSFMRKNLYQILILITKYDKKITNKEAEKKASEILDKNNGNLNTHFLKFSIIASFFQLITFGLSSIIFKPLFIIFTIILYEKTEKSATKK